MASSNTGMPANAQTEVASKERFFRYFQQEVTALQEQMERLSTTAWSGGERNDAVEHCFAGIERLNHEVKDASSYIPAYDQRTYGEAVKALNAKLQTIRAQFAPPKKFQFKTARKNNSAISLSDAAELAKQKQLGVPGNASDISNANSSFAPTPLDKLSPSEEKTQESLEASLARDGSAGEDDAASEVTGAIRTMSFSNERSVRISNLNRSHILLPTSASHATSSGTVSNLRHSVVDLSPPTTNGGPFANLYLKKIKNSLIVCGQVSGPAHITAVENSVLVVACRQFRMHGSKNVDIYLFCGSRPIIEDCENVRFSPLPEAYSVPDFASTTNLWDQIDDFKWLKAEPSPNFSLLPAEDRIDDDVWRKTVPGGHNVGLEDILKAVSIV